MTKKDVFVAEDLLLHGIGDEAIFVTQASQIMKYNKNSTFNDINRTSQKLTCVAHSPPCFILLRFVFASFNKFVIIPFVRLCRPLSA